MTLEVIVLMRKLFIYDASAVIYDCIGDIRLAKELKIKIRADFSEL